MYIACIRKKKNAHSVNALQEIVDSVKGRTTPPTHSKLNRSTTKELMRKNLRAATETTYVKTATQFNAPKIILMVLINRTLGAPSQFIVLLQP